MNQYTFITIENIAGEMGDAYLDNRFDDLAFLASEMIGIVNEVKYAAKRGLGESVEESVL